jgi:F-box/leucine-rich repeat protein 14
MGRLHSLYLRSCDNIIDTGIMPEPLRAGWVLLPQVGDQSLAYTAQGLDKLKSLCLCSCPTMTMTSTSLWANRRAAHANISQCVTITDKGLELTAEHLSQLTGIDLYGCTQITKHAWNITQLSCLKVLNLGLWQMTDNEKVRVLHSNIQDHGVKETQRPLSIVQFVNLYKQQRSS